MSIFIFFFRCCFSCCCCFLSAMVFMSQTFCYEVIGKRKRFDADVFARTFLHKLQKKMQKDKIYIAYFVCARDKRIKNNKRRLNKIRFHLLSVEEKTGRLDRTIYGWQIQSLAVMVRMDKPNSA